MLTVGGRFELCLINSFKGNILLWSRFPILFTVDETGWVRIVITISRLKRYKICKRAGKLIRIGIFSLTIFRWSFKVFWELYIYLHGGAECSKILICAKIYASNRPLGSRWQTNANMNPTTSLLLRQLMYLFYLQLSLIIPIIELKTSN